jgi:FAD/FMN-containing dehydrogenase
MLAVDAVWADSVDEERSIAWVRKWSAAAEVFSNGGSYLNILGPTGDDEEELLRSSLGASNYDRLAAIKRKYDPDNMFRVNFNIPPTALPAGQDEVTAEHAVVV